MTADAVNVLRSGPGSQNGRQGQVFKQHTQSFQKSLIKGCTLTHNENPYMIEGIFLDSEFLEALGIPCLYAGGAPLQRPTSPMKPPTKYRLVAVLGKATVRSRGPFNGLEKGWYR